MTDTLSPSEVRAARLVRSGSPHQFVSVVCGLPLARVKQLHARQKAQDVKPCLSVREAVRSRVGVPKMRMVQYKQVEPYECEGCHRLVYLEPCVACMARQVLKDGKERN